MNLSDYQRLLSRYGFDENDPLDDWVNAGLNELYAADEWWFLEAESNGIAVSAGGNTITSPSDLGKPIKIADVTGVSSSGGWEGDLEFWDRRRWNREILNHQERGQPLYYTMLAAGTIRIWPVSDKARTFDMVYQKGITNLSSPSDIPTWLPTIFHYVPLYRMASIALMAESEEDRAQTAETQFEAGILKMQNYYTARELGDADQVLDVQGYFDGN